jgi:hypothetical protein
MTSTCVDVIHATIVGFYWMGHMIFGHLIWKHIHIEKALLHMIGLPWAFASFGDFWRLDGFSPWSVGLAVDKVSFHAIGDDPHVE